jgi:hypothetical protein
LSLIRAETDDFINEKVMQNPYLWRTSQKRRLIGHGGTSLLLKKEEIDVNERLSVSNNESSVLRHGASLVIQCNAKQEQK